nr:MAG: ORF1 [TTV-like mini virus]
MPWFWRRGYYPRRRRTWRRRPRGLFRRRLWRTKRRRRYPVRRKLPFLRLKQWQPRYINKLKVTVTVPLYATTKDRINHNSTLYLDEIAPHNVPSLGGFSINVFTLNTLYELFLQGRAWWSHSNNDKPLIRFTGTKILLYRAESSDYVFKYFNCYPMVVSMEAYNSTQPTFMTLSKNHLIMRCKKHNYIKKPYHKIKVHPPAQLTNKWFFQKDLANTPLLMTFATGMSLDRFYMSSNSQSTTTGFKGLNTNYLKYHNFTQQTTSGYHPMDSLYFWTVQQSTTKPNIDDIEFQNLIYLGNTQNMQPGTTIKDCNQSTDWTTKKNTYKSDWGHWGNPFIPFYFTGPWFMLYTKTHLSDMLDQMDNGSSKLSSLKSKAEKYHFKQWTEPLIFEYRYNPFGDTGPNNKIYLVSLDSLEPNWDPPQDEKQQNNDLPLWLGLWGFTDYMKLNKIEFDTKKLLVIQTSHVLPQHKYIVPIDQDFLNGNSPFRDRGQVTASDRLQWHPKGSFQLQSITNICQTGPGTIKLPTNVSAEAHMKLTFYFKLGGCAQPIKLIDKPSDQPDFPIPRTESGQCSLQSPETAIQNYFYSFDWRRHFLTKKAADRIEKDTLPEIITIPPTGIHSLNARPPIQETSQGSPETEEKEAETLLQLFNLLKSKQHNYRQRILQLMLSE